MFEIWLSFTFSLSPRTPQKDSDTSSLLVSPHPPSAKTQSLTKNSVVTDHFDNSVTAEILRTKFPEQAHRIPKGAVTFSEHFKSDSSKVQKQLDFKFTSFEKSVVDTATALFALEKELKA